MSSYSVSQLSDHALLRDLAASVRQDRATTATMLAQIAEVDYRKLYRPAAYESMYLYCVHELRMCEEAAYRRIRVARTARKFPGIFPALADGRLNMTAVLLLTPHLTSQNADELLAAATHKTKAEIDLLLAQRFPLKDLPTLVKAIAPAVAVNEPAVPQVVPSVESNPTAGMEPLAPEPVVPSAGSKLPSHMEPLPQRAKLAPLSPGRFAWQVTVDQETQDQMRYAQALLGHAVPSGDVAQVLKRAMNALVRELERDKF